MACPLQGSKLKISCNFCPSIFNHPNKSSKDAESYRRCCQTVRLPSVITNSNGILCSVRAALSQQVTYGLKKEAALLSVSFGKSIYIRRNIKGAAGGRSGWSISLLRWLLFHMSSFAPLTKSLGCRVLTYTNIHKYQQPFTIRLLD